MGQYLRGGGPKDSVFFLFALIVAPHSMQNFSSPTRIKTAPPMAVGLRTGVDPLLVGVRTVVLIRWAYLAKSIIDKITSIYIIFSSGISL